MKSPAHIRSSVALSLLALATVVIFSAVSARAQLGPPASSSQGSQAVQLPLSGRAGQNGSVNTTQTPVPGATTSVNTLNSAVQVQGPYAGSADSTGKIPFSGKLSLREAIDRGLAYNLGAVDLAQSVRQAQGASRVARSALLPNLNGSVSETYETENLRALGFRFNFPIAGFIFPTLIGPFNFLDARASLSQNIVDLTALNNYRSAAAVSRSNQLSSLDAKDLVVLAVGGTYLEVLAAKARVDSARAQLDTANALYQQTLQQRSVGLVAQIDANHSQIQALTEQQRLLSLQNDLAKQKINLARLTGLPPTDQYDLTDDIPYQPAPAIEFAEALKQAFDHRADLKAAESQVRAAELSRSAARAERLPSFSVNANYGAIGTNPAQAKGTYTVAGTVRVPIWQGGRAGGDVEQEDAALAQRRAEIEDLKSSIESQVRNALLDLQTASSQVELAQKNLDVTRETLDLTRQRFDAGVTDSVEVVQAAQTVASAQLDYINSLFAHNIAKLSLARAVGGAAQSLPQFLKLP
jgi:outer membrane protein TolC